MTRRDVLWALAASPLVAQTASDKRLSVEGYIFQQYAEERKKLLGDVIGECFAMAKAAGFANIELNSGFFKPEIRDKALSLLRGNGLSMPSVYVGGGLHTKALAEKTIASAIEVGHICTPFGCKAIVTNPDPKTGDSPKTDAELAIEAESLNQMGRVLSGHGLQLRVHHHTPQLVNNGREWRYILRNTDPQYVSICVDVDWAYEGGFEAVPFLREVGSRLQELHVRSAKNKVWLEDVEDSDIDYRAVAAYLDKAGLQPLIVVELAYRPATVKTRSLEADLAVSRKYTQKVFAL